MGNGEWGIGHWELGIGLGRRACSLGTASLLAANPIDIWANHFSEGVGCRVILGCRE